MVAHPVLQKLNSLIHREPFSFLFRGAFWSIVALLVTPVVSIFVWLETLWNLFQWMTGFAGTNAYDPSRFADMELAVVITGCDSGFGKEIALVAAQEGFVVFAGCLSQESFAQFQHSTMRSGTSIVPIQLNVTQDKDVMGASQVVRRWLQDPKATKQRVLHALCNNAGIGSTGDVDWESIDDYKRLMDVNYFGIIRCCQAFIPIFKKQAIERSHTAGRILNITSMAGVMLPAPGLSAYSASKHAAVALTSAMRQELALFGIQVCTVCPSFHGTPLVSSMHDIMRKKWESIPKETRAEYGEETLECFIKMADKIHEWTWSMDTVVQELSRGLKGRNLPAEILVGLDARSAMLIMTILPTWLVEFVYKVVNPSRPIPRAMKSTVQ